MTYHWRDNWFFMREPDGSVSIKAPAGGDIEARIAVIPADEWASIIASVSASGDTAETYRLAQLFHNNKALSRTPLGKLMAALGTP